jgi:hypothetical protein
MATVSQRNIIPPKQAEAAQTTQYAAPVAGKTIIDKFTATNTTLGPVTFSINLVPALGAPAVSNRILSLRSIAAGETYICPEVVGHIVEAGGEISTLAGAPAALTICASGREIA